MWIKVENSLPEKSENIIVFHINSAGKHVDFAEFKDYAFFDYENKQYGIVTHWMRLPAPPTADTKE